MKKITDKDVEALKAGKKVTKGFIHMQLDDKGRLNMWADINITDKYRDQVMKPKKILMDFKTHKVSRNIRMLVPLMNVLLLNSRTGKWDIWHQWENGWRS